jgi:hypothetical protein
LHVLIRLKTDEKPDASGLLQIWGRFLITTEGGRVVYILQHSFATLTRLSPISQIIKYLMPHHASGIPGAAARSLMTSVMKNNNKLFG